MQLSTHLVNFVLLVSTTALAQEFGWNATTDGDWAIVGHGMASYMRCINSGVSMSACLRDICSWDTYSPFLAKCCPDVGTNPSDSACSSAFSGTATQSRPASATISIDGDDVNCRDVGDSWASCATRTSSFFALATSSQAPCICKPITAVSKIVDDFYWDEASSCYNYLAAVAPSTFAASYSSALNEVCRPSVNAGFGGASAATTTDSGGAGQTASPSSTSQNSPQKTSGAVGARLTSWDWVIVLGAAHTLLAFCNL